MKQDVLEFLVTNNEEILKQISPCVIGSLEEGLEVEDAVFDCLKDFLISHFDLNYLEIYDILEHNQAFRDLYFSEELYKHGKLLH